MDQSADHWHSIRPWIHRFILSVNHVSSVSATFTLKSALTAEPLDPALESLLEEEQDESHCGSTDHADTFARSRTVSDALTRGLSVKVNSSPWQRVLLRIDEESDKAVIIVFGLMPGRQYDVELGIAHPQEPLRSQITTDADDPRKPFLRIFSNRHALRVPFPIQCPIEPPPAPLRMCMTIATQTDLPLCPLSCQTQIRHLPIFPSHSLRSRIPLHLHPRLHLLPILPRCQPPIRGKFHPPRQYRQ